MNYKILIVDDDRSLQTILKNSLMSAGFEVYTAENGQECLEVLETLDPSVIIMDHIMPKMNGLSTLKIMQERQMQIPVIMISSEDIKPNVPFLRKPFKINQIIEAIHESLGH